MRCIIAGGRQFDDYETLCEVMACFPEVSKVVSGCAAGADTLGIEWARSKGLPVDEFPAKWTRHGRRAGFIRNTTMARNADMLVAFWDGVSPGTRHMIKEARKQGLTVRVVPYCWKSDDTPPIDPRQEDDLIRLLVQALGA